MRRSRALALVVVAGGVVFGFFGGEYSTWDWWQLRNDVKTTQGAITSLQTQIDSLSKVAHLLETDSATQERVAREQFGMVRKGELLFRVVPDTQP